MRRLLLCLVLVAASAPLSAYEQRLFGPFFIADGKHVSRLRLHNRRGDHAVTARPFLTFENGTRISLGALALRPKETRTIDIDSTLLRQSGQEATTGAIMVELDFHEAQPVEASLLVQHRNGSRYTVPLFRRDQIRGTVQEAVFLIPGAAGRAFIALQNTADESRGVTVDVEANGALERAAKITLPPGGNTRVNLDAVLARMGARDAAAVRVTNDGAAGDVTAAGAVTDPQRRYAARIRFNDLAHGEHSRVLRGQFLLLGQQDRSIGFPANSEFTARCALRNPTQSVKIAHPRVKWLDGGVTREVRLPALRLAPGEVRILDLTAAQARGAIPPTFHMGSLEIAYEGGGGHLLGQLTSVDSTHGLAIDASMTSHESKAVSGMAWSIEQSDQTLISITNAARQHDSLSIQLFTSAGTTDLPAVQLGPGELALLDVRSLAAAAKVVDATGTFAVRGSGSRTAFRLERLMITPSRITSDIGSEGFDEPVAYLDSDGDERVLWIRTDTSEPPQSDTMVPEWSVTLDLSTTARWSSGTATTNETETAEYVTTDTDILSIRQPPSPQVTVFLSVHRPPSIAELIARFHDPCANNYLHTSVVRFSMPRSAYQITNDEWPMCVYRPTCLGSCSTTSYVTIRAGAGPCVNAPAVWVQCYGLAVNGRCIINQAVCHHQSEPGVCD